MKKRSLFAAVVMLIVSAIVLTSATYAWFAGNSKVEVSTISASVNASNGSLQISYNNSDWSKLVLTQTDLAGVSSNHFPEKLTPVDFGFNGATISEYKAVFGTGANANVLSLNGTVANTDYVNFTFYVKASQADTAALLKPTFTDDTNYSYMAVQVGSGDWTVYSKDGNGYTALSTNSGSVTDQGNFYVDAADNGYSNQLKANPETITTTTNTGSIPVTLGTTSTAINVRMWAEGQDPQCFTAAGTESITCAFSVELAPTSP